MAPGTREVAYVGSDSRGVHSSTDGGATWPHVEGLQLDDALSIAFDPADVDRLWIGGAGVHRTTEG